MAGDQSESTARMARTIASSISRPARKECCSTRTARPATPISATGTGRGRQLGRPGNSIKSGNSRQRPLKASRGHRAEVGIGANHASHANPPAYPQSSNSVRRCRERGEAPRANEILCFRLDGSMRVLVVAPEMTNLNAYRRRRQLFEVPKGNLDVTGEVLHLDGQHGRQSARRLHRPRAVAAADRRAAATASPGHDRAVGVGDLAGGWRHGCGHDHRDRVGDRQRRRGRCAVQAQRRESRRRRYRCALRGKLDHVDGFQWPAHTVCGRPRCSGQHDHGGACDRHGRQRWGARRSFRRSQPRASRQRA